MSIQTALVLGLIFALVATVALFVFVLPQKKNGQMGPFLQFLHDTFHFKKLFLELILKILYAFSTCLSIFSGFFLLFSRTEYISNYYFSQSIHYESTAMMGLFFLIVGPIVLRIAYEFFMILILAAKTLLEINRKLTPIVESVEHTELPEPNYLYCTQCGTRYDANQGNCPNCGKQ
jgi:hypothetical protein